MKFSRSLEFACTSSEWKSAFLNYASLKKLINQIAAAVAQEKANSTVSTNLGTLEARFDDEFKEQLDKVSKFFATQKNILLSPSLSATATTANQQNEKISSPSHVTETIEADYAKLCALKEFLQLNHTGLIKLLKSHDKYSKTLVQAKLQALVEVSLPMGDLEHVQEEISKVEQKYADVCYSGDLEVAKGKLLDLLQEHAVKRQATAWQEMVERDRVVTVVTVSESDDAHPEKVHINSPTTTTASTSCQSHAHKGKKSISYDFIKLFALVALFCGLLYFPVLADKRMNNCMAMCVFAIGLWMTEAVPLYVTALLIPILLVLLKMYLKPDNTPLSAGDAAKLITTKMFTPITLMLIGGFSIGAATNKYGVARQVAMYLLKYAGSTSGSMVAFMMILAQLMSAFISNVTSPVLCYTLLSPLLQAIPPGSPLGRQLVLAVAVAANLGGGISPISSPQNVLAVGYLEPIGWFQWLAIAVPFCLTSSALCWFVIMGRMKNNKPINTAAYFNTGSNFVWGVKEITVVLTILGTIMIWALPQIGANVFGNNGFVAIIPVLVFFGTGLLGKEDFNSFQWNVVMLAIGGTLMGDSVKESGLLNYIGTSFQFFTTSSLFTQLSLISLIVTIATCFISHTVGAMIFLPLVQAVSNNSRVVIMGAALACSAGMALPISSFPNMAAAGQEDNLGRPFLRSSEFIRYGIVCSLITWVVICTVGYGMMCLVGL